MTKVAQAHFGPLILNLPLKINKRNATRSAIEPSFRQGTRRDIRCTQKRKAGPIISRFPLFQ
jgi:hypothetical protein